MGMRTGLLVAALAVLGCTAQLSGPSGNGGMGGPMLSGGGSGGSGTTLPQDVAPGCTNESPSPRLLRQLTRSEYGRTVADLLSLADPNITAIPPDGQMRGFTNNVAIA